MKDQSQKRNVSVRVIIRIVMGMLFVVSGADKIFHPQEYTQTVQSYQILPEWSVQIFSVIVIAVELSAGLALMLNRFLRTGCIALTMLLSLFILAMINVLSNGSSIDCGCFGGVYSETVSPLLLVRNAALIAVLLWLSTKEKMGDETGEIEGRLPK